MRIMGHYNIAQLAEVTGLSAHTLRYYEKESLFQTVPRDAGGRRRYSEEHLLAVRFVNALRATGMPIKEIKQYLDLYQAGPSTNNDRLALLESHRDNVIVELASVKSNLNVINKKIQAYKEHIIK